MFSNTAYEAVYQYLGLELHSRFIEVITSQKVFLATLALIFGFMFFLTSVQFFSRYLPGALVSRRHVPLSKFFKIICLLFLSISILKVESTTGVKRFNGQSWDRNPYIHGQLRNLAPQYRVSFVFDIMSRTAEEIAALLSRVIDDLFKTTNSQLEAPNFFFKALMYGAANTIEDADLKRSIRFYTDECFDRLLPLIDTLKKENKLDGFFASNAGVDQKLSRLTIETPDRTPYTCLDLKNDVRSRLKDYALSKPGMGANLETYMKNNPGMNSTSWQNYEVSNFLVNEYHGQNEAALGVQKASQVPTTGGRIIQYLHRITGFDGLLSLVSNGSLQGAWVNAERSQEFSENLARAPHVAGFIKMFLIAAFPWLIFAVVAGYWRVLIQWWLIYFSVLLWTPLWTLLYHVMTSIALSAEVLEAFGKLNDGISLYSAQLVSSRIYHLFAVYSWLQLLTGTALTGMLMYFIKPALSDTESDSSPEIMNGVATAAKTFGSVL